MARSYPYSLEQQDKLTQFKHQALLSLEQLLYDFPNETQLHLLEKLQKKYPNSNLYFGFYRPSSELLEVPIYILKTPEGILVSPVKTGDKYEPIFEPTNENGFQSHLILQREYH